ncbi:hypothetical protein GCM10029964_038100 [Kibdelosporangium lantanae]
MVIPLDRFGNYLRTLTSLVGKGIPLARSRLIPNGQSGTGDVDRPELPAARDAELPVGPRKVELDRSHRDEELGGYLAVAVAGGGQETILASCLVSALDVAMVSNADCA